MRRFIEKIDVEHCTRCKVALMLPSQIYSERSFNMSRTYRLSYHFRTMIIAMILCDRALN
jgi:hypothetical protein